MQRAFKVCVKRLATNRSSRAVRVVRERMFLFPAALSSALAKKSYNISSANLSVHYIDPLFIYQYSFINLSRSGKQRAFRLAG